MLKNPVASSSESYQSPCSQPRLSTAAWVRRVLIVIAAALFTFGAAHAAVTEKVPDLLIEYPDEWTIGPPLNQAVELVRTQGDDVLSRITFTFEERGTLPDAMQRAKSLVASLGRPVETTVINGWPAFVQESLQSLPQRHPTADKTIAIRSVVVLVAGTRVYVGRGWTLQTAPPQVRQQVLNILTRVRPSVAGSNAASTQLLQDVMRQLDQEPAPVLTPSPKPPAAGVESNTGGVGAASTEIANSVGQGEFSVALSQAGQNIVVGAQNSAFSSRGGGPLAVSTFAGAWRPTSGDPSAAYAGSGSFYLSQLRVAGEGCSVQIARSDDQGGTFNWNGSSPIFSPEPAPGPAGRFFPDQPHIAAAGGSSPSPTSDVLYAVWRHFAPLATPNQNPPPAPTNCSTINNGARQAMVSCSVDGGQTWSTATPVGQLYSDYPRVTFDGAWVYVSFVESGKVMLDQFWPCAATQPMSRQQRYPREVGTIGAVPCPIAGLDRCGPQLQAPSVASDGTRIVVSYAQGNGNGSGTDIVVQESYDFGGTWTSPSVVNDSGAEGQARFMPWTCMANTTAYIGWYDRRNSTSNANPDLTDYFVTSFSRNQSGIGPGQLGRDIRMTRGSDPQCLAAWPVAPDLGALAFANCPAPPATVNGGSCTAACTSGTATPAGCACSALGVLTCACTVQNGVFAPVAPCTSACTGTGWPRYGDYNTLACSGKMVAAVWASTMDVNGNPSRTNTINLSVRTLGLGLRDRIGTAYSGNFIQRDTSQDAIPEFDLLLPTGGAGSTAMRHFVRSNVQAAFPWTEQFPLILFINEQGSEDVPLGAALIQSQFSPSGASSDSALHAVVRMQLALPPGTRPTGPRTQYLTEHRRAWGANSWSALGPISVGGRKITGATGDPALIQSTRGDKGNFEMLVPEGRQIAHYTRDNDRPGTPWTKVADLIPPAPFTARNVPVDAALIQSTYRQSGTNTGDLEAVIRMRSAGGEYLDQYSFDASAQTWSRLGTVAVGGSPVAVSGTPAFVESDYARRRFELLVPSGRDVVHYFNDSRTANRWTKVASLYPAPASPNVVRPYRLGAALFQGTFGSPRNLEAVVYQANPINGSTAIEAWFFSPGEQRWQRIGPVLIGATALTGLTGF